LDISINPHTQAGKAVFLIVSQQKSTPNRPALVFKKQALLGKNKRRPPFGSLRVTLRSSLSCFLLSFLFLTAAPLSA